MTEISGKIPLILMKLLNKSPQNIHFNNGMQSSIQINISVSSTKQPLSYMILFGKSEHYCCNFPVLHTVYRVLIGNVAYGVKSGNDSQGLQVDFSRIKV